MAQNAPTNTPARSQSPQHDVSMLIFPPIVHTVWGMVLLVGFVLGMMLQIQSTEAWMLGEKAAALTPDISVFAQFPDFFSRHLPPDVSTAFLVAWAVELTYITIKIGTARPQSHVLRRYGGGSMSEAVLKSARIRAGVWSVLSWAILAFNAFTDWTYSTSLGGWQQLAFIVIVGCTTFFFGTLGIQNLVAGMSKIVS